MCKLCNFNEIGKYNLKYSKRFYMIVFLISDV